MKYVVDQVGGRPGGDAWQQAVTETYFPLDTEYRNRHEFTGALESWSLGQVGVSKMRCDGVFYRRHRRHFLNERDASLLITIPEVSEVNFTQGARTVRCNPGSFLLERGDEPYEFWHGKANSVCAPVVVDYVSRLSEKLAEAGYKRDLLLLHSGGGVMTPASVKEFSARLAGSGIAAGAIDSRFIGNLCGFPNSIGFDMGGTSTDVSLAYNGESRITKDWYIEYGYPIRFPSIEVLTIGAGGGSLAWRDEGGSLRNGPQSAGAYPGPACYKNGNRTATNTDANVVLGRLGTSLAGGKITLDPALATEAVRETVAEPFQMELHQAAEAIVAVANANMANAVRLLSISRGYDPRDFALVAFGGAGALHGAAVAKELAIPTVIVPPNPGVTSALGCLLVDVQHDFSESFMADAAGVAPDAIEKAFAGIEAQAVERLSHEGVARADMALMRSVEMMYHGQWRSLAVAAPAHITSVSDLVEAFHAEHEREFNFRRDDAPVAIFRIAVKAIGTVPKADMTKHEVTPHTPQPIGRRAVWFDGVSHDAAIYQRETLAAGAAFSGPAIVEQFDSTTVVPPGMSARVDAYMNILIGTKG